MSYNFLCETLRILSVPLRNNFKVYNLNYFKALLKSFLNLLNLG